MNRKRTHKSNSLTNSTRFLGIELVKHYYEHWKWNFPSLCAWIVFQHWVISRCSANQLCMFYRILSWIALIFNTIMQCMLWHQLLISTFFVSLFTKSGYVCNIFLFCYFHSTFRLYITCDMAIYVSTIMSLNAFIYIHVCTWHTQCMPVIALDDQDNWDY